MKVKIIKNKDSICIERSNRLICIVDFNDFENFLNSPYLDFKGFKNIAYPRSKYNILFKKIYSKNEFVIINGSINININLEDFFEYFLNAAIRAKEFEIIRKTRYGIPLD